MFRALFASLFLLSATVAAHAAPAAPFKVKNAKVVRVKVGADSKAGLQLVADDHGWRMKLDHAPTSLLRLSVIDVTPNTPAQTMSVRVNAGEALFDAHRFQGGHVYRVSAPGLDGASFVYLAPSATLAAPAPKGPGRVDFEEGESAVADEGGIETAKKGSL